MTRRFALTGLLCLIVTTQAGACLQPKTSPPVTAWARALFLYPGVNTWNPLDVSWVFTFQQNGQTINTQSVTVNATIGETVSVSGTTKVEAVNNTTYSVTLNPDPTLKIKVGGFADDVSATNTSASASASVNSVSESGAAPPDFDKEKSVTFSVINLAPGAKKTFTGTFSLSANGGN